MAKIGLKHRFSIKVDFCGGRPLYVYSDMVDPGPAKPGLARPWAGLDLTKIQAWTKIVLQVETEFHTNFQYETDFFILITVGNGIFSYWSRYQLCGISRICVFQSSRRTERWQSKPMQPCSVAVALNAVGDPRLLPTRKQDDLTRCICMLFSSALWSCTWSAEWNALQQFTASTV